MPKFFEWKWFMAVCVIDGEDTRVLICPTCFKTATVKYAAKRYPGAEIRTVEPLLVHGRVNLIDVDEHAAVAEEYRG